MLSTIDRARLYENAKTSSPCRLRRNLSKNTHRNRRILMQRAYNRITPSTDVWRVGRNNGVCVRHTRDTDSQAEEDTADGTEEEEEEEEEDDEYTEDEDDEEDIDTDSDSE